MRTNVMTRNAADSPAENREPVAGARKRAYIQVFHEPRCRDISSRIEPSRSATSPRSAGHTDFRKFARRCSGDGMGMVTNVIAAGTLYRKRRRIAKEVMDRE